jgi:nickel transport protein
MRPKIVFGLICTVNLAITLIFAGAAGAHGTGFRLIPEERPLAVQFYYAGGAPMGYAEIHIRSPRSQRPEYQNGRTDGRGIFAFCPDKPGKWELVVNDGRGHKARAVIDVPDTKDPVQAAPEKTSRTGPGWLEIIMALSILINIWLVIGYIKKLRQS